MRGRSCCLMGEPVHAACPRIACMLVHGFDQRPAHALAAGVGQRKQILQVTVRTRRPARAMINGVHDAQQTLLRVKSA